MKKKSYWKYKLDTNDTKVFSIKSYELVYKYSSLNFSGNILFRNEWVTIKVSNDSLNITVKEGYSWNGCDPKFEFLHQELGTPDGSFNSSTQRPYTYYASLVHDILCQFESLLVFTREEIDFMFYLILKDSKFFWSWVYWKGVRLYALFSKEKTKEFNLNDEWVLI